jgi:hypothetical protein
VWQLVENVAEAAAGVEAEGKCRQKFPENQPCQK